MKLSARNQLKGKIIEVKKGATTTHVRIDIGGQTTTASITNESAEELKLATGKTDAIDGSACDELSCWLRSAMRRLACCNFSARLVSAPSPACRWHQRV